MKIKKIALFASGSGSNVQNIIEHFAGKEEVVVDSVWSNKKDAYALERARNLNVDTFNFDRDTFINSDKVVEKLKERGIDLIVLAGFLWLVPENLIRNFTIINIHPALLPKYGGKGMYGMRVHEAIVANGERESGISIHFVNEKFDEGEVIFQARCRVEPEDTAEDIARKVHQLEYKHFPEVIEKLLGKSEIDPCGMKILG